MYAARKGHTEVVKLLLEHGADVRIRDNKGWRALRWAKEKGHIEIVRLLEKKEAELKRGCELELLSWSWHVLEFRTGIEVVGQVKNISLRPLYNVWVVANFYDADGNFIMHEVAPIEFDPLLVGQTSPFKLIMFGYNPAIKKVELQFKFLGGRIIPTYY
jgi:hypothetical protein